MKTIVIIESIYNMQTMNRIPNYWNRYKKKDIKNVKKIVN